MRIDKWLWAARFFKTRALATKACELGRVQWRGNDTKPSREVRIGDVLQIKNGSGDFEVNVLNLSEVRGPAPVARELYLETDRSRELRAQVAEQRRTMVQYEPAPETKPSKRDRRELARLRDQT